MLHPRWNVKAQGAHQTNRREQKFAFCSGLVFTSADTGSILSAKANTDRGLPAQAAVGLLLLLEAPVGMLETGRLTGPLGRSLRTPAPESGAPFVHQVRLPRLSSLQGPPLKHPLCAGAATGIGWIQRATCVWSCRTKRHPGRRFQKPHAGGRQSYQLFDKGSRLTVRHNQPSSQERTWPQTLRKFLLGAQAFTQKVETGSSGPAHLCCSEAPHGLQRKPGES